MVTLRAGKAATRHEVVVPVDLLAELGLAAADEGRLVRASFEFLLDREPPTSILGRFGLEVIGSYFPDYLEAMHRRFAR